MKKVRFYRASDKALVEKTEDQLKKNPYSMNALMTQGFRVLAEGEEFPAEAKEEVISKEKPTAIPPVKEEAKEEVEPKEEVPAEAKEEAKQADLEEEIKKEEKAKPVAKKTAKK